MEILEIGAIVLEAASLRSVHGGLQSLSFLGAVNVATDALLTLPSQVRAVTFQKMVTLGEEVALLVSGQDNFRLSFVGGVTLSRGSSLTIIGTVSLSENILFCGLLPDAGTLVLEGQVSMMLEDGTAMIINGALPGTVTATALDGQVIGTLTRVDRDIRGSGVWSYYMYSQSVWHSADSETATNANDRMFSLFLSPVPISFPSVDTSGPGWSIGGDYADSVLTYANACAAAGLRPMGTWDSGNAGSHSGYCTQFNCMPAMDENSIVSIHEAT